MFSLKLIDPPCSLLPELYFKPLYNFRAENRQKNKKMKESLLPMKKYLGFDLSTQSLKVMIVTEDMEIVYQDCIKYGNYLYKKLCSKPAI